MSPEQVAAQTMCPPSCRTFAGEPCLSHMVVAASTVSALRGAGHLGDGAVPSPVAALDDELGPAPELGAVPVTVTALPAEPGQLSVDDLTLMVETLLGYAGGQASGTEPAQHALAALPPWMVRLVLSVPDEGGLDGGTAA